MDEKETIRAKILGVLLRDARLYAGRSAADCAALLNLSAADYTAAEEGRLVPSLPELELLAHYLDVPLSHFWNGEILSENPRFDYDRLVRLRQQAVGGRLRQARLKAGKLPKEVAKVLGVTAGEVKAIEQGHAAIPVLRLERLAETLGLSLDYFMAEQQEPAAEPEINQEQPQPLAALPADLQAFVLEPGNLHYLETARRLSQMDGAKLRAIAENLLEITY